MSDIKIYGKLKSGVTTKALVDATEVAGGFMSLTTDEMNSLSDALKVEGMLVYCTSDSKFYQLKQGKWAVALEQEQKTFGDVVTDVSFSGSQSVSLVKTLKNIETGAYSTDATPVPTAHQFGSGLMSASDYNLLQTLSQNVQQLQGSQVRLLYTDSANPLQSQISSFVSSKGYTDYTGISVVIDATQHVWRYYSNDNIGWKDDGLDIVTTFTNDTAGIVKGSTDNGKINAESDGTGSVNGWSDLTQRVSNVESQATVQNLIGEINLTNEGTTVEKQDNSLLVKSTCKISNHDNTISTPVTAQFNVPIKAGNNITFTEATDKSAVIISATASAEVSQPDYNQNDSAAADYIKNRPFYEETKTALAEVFSETLAFEWNAEANAGSSVSEFAGASMKGVAVGESVMVIFNGVEYNLTTQELPDEFKGEIEAVGGAGFLAGAAWPTSESWTPPENLPFSLVFMWASVDGQESTVVYGATSINQASIPVIVKAVVTTTELHTIDPKFIKDMYYSTEVLSPLIDFKVISGDINTIGSTMVVQYDGKEYTETVKDGAEEGNSDHVSYIGFKMDGTATPTEEQPFCYGINILFGDDTKQLFCAAPKTVSENEVIIYNGESKTVKKMTVEGLSFLYVGNIHLISEDFEDTGEQYLILFDYLSAATQGKLDFVVSIVPQDSISCEVKGENTSYINPKYIKDMYYETRTETKLFNGVADITTEESSNNETYYTGTLTPSFTLGESGDKCEVSIDGAVYTLDVLAAGTFSLAGIQNFSNGIPVYIETDDGVTKIGSKTLYTGAVVIKNIHTDIKQIPSKYVPQGGDIVEITITKITDTAIAAALETYLKANTDIAKRLVSSSTFTLKLKSDAGVVSYKFTANTSDPNTAALIGSWFTSIAIEDDFWSNNRYLENRIVRIKSDGSVKYITSIIYDKNLFFGIPDTEGLAETAGADLAKLGFYRRGEVGLTAESNTITLPEWIKYAQQRADFAIPTPTKDTDLVDKKYADIAISNAITKTLNTEV